MATSANVRASRDGDRFHYYWAARRALRLLDPTADLQLVTVEGLPEGDTAPGEEVIDVAEYFGGQNAATSTRFCFSQLKHSTVRTADLIEASELRTTLEKFARIYRAAVQAGHDERLEFRFVANRRLKPVVRSSLAQLASGASGFTDETVAQLLRGYLAFGDDNEHEAAFCKRLELDDGVPGLRDLEGILRDDLQQFLPGGGTGTEMTMLIETVTRCATSSADSQSLTKSDILVALRTTSEELLPASSRIEELAHVVRTRDVEDVVAQLKTASHNKFLITAVGGVGKSVLASTLGESLPDGSTTVVYDCFAGGDYRKITAQRHEHRVALTQISNELAARGLCTPLIPTVASDAAYTRVFMRRVDRAASLLADEQPGALLAVVIDAADNAAMAAKEFKRRTFVTDLFREEWPANARLIQFCRPERRAMLNVPSVGVAEVALRGFRRRESLEHLKTRFPDATMAQAAQLHALSGGNPRVQAMTMENAGSVAEVLQALEIARTEPGEVLDSLLSRQIAEVADAGHLTSDELSRLCRALATLHPPVPLAELAEISGVHADAIRGFAVALGRGLFAAGNVIQFRDEPTETWFRKAHGLSVREKQAFVSVVKPLANTSPYVANALPQLLFEAEMLDELAELARSNAALPGDVNQLQAQEIARSRARFALGAMLQAGRNEDAALLAVAAGDMSSGHSRKVKIYRENSDMTARFMNPDVIDDLCSGRELAVEWPGSNLHVEAALLSAVDQFQDLARSRLRAAHNNFVSILKLPDDEHLARNIGVAEVADLALAATNIDGAEGGIRYLSLWRRDDFVRRVANRLCMRLAEAGRLEAISTLVTKSRRGPVRAAAAEVLYDFNVVPTKRVLRKLVKSLRARQKPYKQFGALSNQPDLRGVVWTLTHAVKYGQLERSEVLRILDVHLPARLPDWAGSVDSHSPVSALLGYALRAHLTTGALTKQDVASEKLLEEMKHEYSTDRHRREFESNIVRLLPWAECWLAAILEGDSDSLKARAVTLVERDLKPVSSHQTPFLFINGIAEIMTRILSGVNSQDLRVSLADWHREADLRLGRSRRIVARIASRSPFLEEFGLEVVARGVRVIQTDRTNADSRIDSLIDLARTLLAVNESEAQSIFEMAVDQAQQVGDDLYARWTSLLHTAQALSNGDEPARAHRLFQIAEELDRAIGEVDEASVADRLAGMHEPTYLAAVSRCRDRRSLSFERLLAPAVKNVGKEDISRLSLFAFDPHWDSAKTVDALNPDLAEMARTVFADFNRHQRSSNEWRQTSGDATSNRSLVAAEATDFQQFADADFTTEISWNEALGELRWAERPTLAEFALFKHASRRPEVLDALSLSSAALSRDFVALAEAAVAVPATPGLQNALGRLGLAYATRFASEICTWIHDWKDDLAIMAEAADESTDELLSVAFRELGTSAHEMSHENYFYLAARLATTLSPSAAGRVFDSLSDLFEAFAPSATTADGSWESQPPPPSGVSNGVSGIIWTALGDISIGMRWRAAHAVLLLVRLGCEDALENLRCLADETKSVAPFVDSRLPFYALHARMWLLLALWRASLEDNSRLLETFIPVIMEIANGPHHIVNQVLSQNILTELSAHGVLAIDDVHRNVLGTRFVPKWVELDWDQRRERPNPFNHSETTDELSDPDRFFYDFERDWCRPLAEVFGATEGDVARLVSARVKEIDGYDLFAARNDPRAKHHVYNESRSFSRAEWPAEDDHGFYLAVHGILTVAGGLASTHIGYKDPENELDAFSEWLAQFLPKRPDGRWLSDCRDHPPRPAPEQALASFGPAPDWASSLAASSFAAAAGFSQEWVSVAADTETRYGDMEEELAIESALVPHQTARALLVAIQTAPSGAYPCALPTTDQHWSDWFGEGLFAVEPWLDSRRYFRGIDQHDERAAGVRYPRTAPAQSVVERFRLVADQDMRRWSSDGVWFRSMVWSDMHQASRDAETGTRGELLQVHQERLTAILSELDRSLLLIVGLRRQLHDTSHSYPAPKQGNIDSDDEFEWLQWSGKAYVINPDGRWLEY